MLNTHSKRLAQMPVTLLACKDILHQGSFLKAGTELTVTLEEYEIISGEQVELAPGEDERIKAAILAHKSKRPSRAEREAEEARRREENRAAITATTAAANQRNEVATRRRSVLDKLIDAAMGKVAS